MTKRLLLAMAIGSVVMGCNKDSTVNRTEMTGGGGEAGDSATGGAIVGSGGGSTSGAGGETESSGGQPTGGAGTGGGAVGGAGGTAETGGEGGETGTGGAGGDAETTGGTSGSVTGGAGGMVATGGAGGAGGDAETAGGEGGVATGGAGGAGGASGSPAGGTVATGGAADAAGGGGPDGEGGAASTGSPVRGQVIDFWGHPLPNVPVEVSGSALTITDEHGRFEVPDVPAVYDASLMIEITQPRREVYGWVYQGLTRRDPTLQVYRGLPQWDATTTFNAEDWEGGDNQTLMLSVVGPDGHNQFSTTNPNYTTFPTWRGPATTSATVHSLVVVSDPETDLPIDYLAYDSSPVSLAGDEPRTVTLDLSPDEIPVGVLLGTVSAPNLAGRENRVFVRFPTGGSIQVVRDTDAGNNLSYLVPTLPGGSITVSASEGTRSYTGFSLVHRDGLAANGEPVALTVPEPSVLLLPADGATAVDSTTQFAFSGSSASGAYLVAMSSHSYYSGLFIVTAREEFTIPEVVGGAFELISDDLTEWHVETHGDWTDVDAMAGPGGFMDAFASDGATPIGPRLGNGAYTASVSRYFTTTP